jgi:hypothetical protein
MTQIHTCYTTSIALKKFLHNSCPEPLDKCYWINEHGDIRSVYKEEVQEWYIPIFCLHDLLSKPFCEAMENRIGNKDQNGELSMLACHYFDGGIEAVEKALCEMMEGK